MSANLNVNASEINSILFDGEARTVLDQVRRTAWEFFEGQAETLGKVTRTDLTFYGGSHYGLRITPDYRTRDGGTGHPELAMTRETVCLTLFTMNDGEDWPLLGVGLSPSYSRVRSNRSVPSDARELLDLVGEFLTDVNGGTPMTDFL